MHILNVIHSHIPRTDRLCNLCNIHVGSELHVLMMCQNSGACSLRDCLKNNIYMINSEISKLNENDLFIYLLLAIDDSNIPQEKYLH